MFEVLLGMVAVLALVVLVTVFVRRNRGSSPTGFGDGADVREARAARAAADQAGIAKQGNQGAQGGIGGGIF